MATVKHKQYKYMYKWGVLIPSQVSFNIHKDLKMFFEAECGIQISRTVTATEFQQISWIQISKWKTFSFGPKYQITRGDQGPT